MLLILCQLDDFDALTFAHRAQAEGTDCHILTAEALSFAHRRSHRISSSAGGPISVRTEIDVNGLPPLTDEHITGVLNRLVEPPTAAWRRAAGTERDYAAAELFAFTLSWLSSLHCPVRNRPTASCLTGPAPHPLLVVAAARRAGIDCPDLRYGSNSGVSADDLGMAALGSAGPRARPVQLVCLDGRVLAGDLPAGLAARVAGMVSALGVDADLLGVDFAVAGDRWVLAGLTPLPTLGGLDRGSRQLLLQTLAPTRTAVA